MTPPTISAVNITQSVAYGASDKQLNSVPCIEIQLADGAAFKGDAILNRAGSLNSSTVALN